MSKVNQALAWLRAAAEPTRLRLLALCSHQDLSVSDLARVLGQSEPRVSRHLKVLCEAGLLMRVRQGQWVHYRLARGEGAEVFVQGLLAQLDRSDDTLSQDRERARAASVGDAVAAPSESRLGRALRAFVDADVSEQPPVESAVVFGVDQLELLECAAALAKACTAIAASRRAAQAARAYAERRGFSCRVVTAHRMSSLDDLPACDALIVNHVAAPERPLPAVLETARRQLASAGRIWLFERYEALEAAREATRARVVEHPLARLRRLFAENGFECRRLTPIEADGEHVLAAAAVPASSSLAARAG